MRSAELKSTLARWRTARRAVLGSIVLAGSLVTSAAVMYRMSARECADYHQVDRAYTYSGIGVVIEREDGEVVVRRVLPDSPAQGVLHRGTRLLSVDGEIPGTLEDWASEIRGEPGTKVQLEIAGPCGGQRVLELERDVIRLRY